METTDDHLYQLMHDIGDSRVRDRYVEMRDSGRFTSTSAGAKLVAEAGGIVCKFLAAYQKVKVTRSGALRVRQLLKEIGRERAVAVSLTYVLNAVVSWTGENDRLLVGRMRNNLGKELKTEMDFLLLSREAPVAYRYTRKNLEGASKRNKKRVKERIIARTGVQECGWDRADMLMLGALLLDFILRYSGVVYLHRDKTEPDFKGKTKFRNSVALTPSVFEWITEGVNFLAASVPSKLPITELPTDWAPGEIGGYPRGLLSVRPLMSCRASEPRKRFTKSLCPEVYRAVNTLQRTSWRVNQDVYEVIRAAVKHEWDIPGLSERPPVRPMRPAHEYVKGDAAWREYGRLKTQFNTLNSRYAGAAMRAARLLGVLEIYKDFDAFYMPHTIDFRGRCYASGSVLNYQGMEHQRAVLQFAEAKPLATQAALDWFLIHGANCWGVDKVSFEDRKAWVKDNHRMICAVAEDWSGHREWTEADKPFQFLAWAFEYRAMWECEDILTFESRIPVAMDGSNNGLQIYSMIMRDEVGGEATNCIPMDTPQDAYQRVADKVTEKLQEYSRTGTDKERRRATELLAFCKRLGSKGVPRKVVKRPVMTQPYGATVFRCQQYTVEWYHEYIRGKNLTPEEAPFPEKDVYNTFTWLGLLIWDAIGEVVIKAREAMDWLRDCADVVSKHTEHCSWTTPLGMECLQWYVRGTTRPIYLKAGGKISMTVWEDDGTVDGRSSKNGLPPNFIHSLDASVLFRTVNSCAEMGVTHFQMIHDSYAVHACYAPVLARTLRESFVDLFEDDLFSKLRDEILEQLPKGTVLPEPPSHGTMSLEDLRDSKYLFA